jgi:hypothetical protein
MMAGRISMNTTNLTESRSKVIGYFEGKDPKHTFRQAMADRMFNHIKEHSEKPIPVNVIQSNEGGQPSLAFVVGSKDANMVEQLLQEHPFPNMDIIFHSWKRKNPEAFNDRMRWNQMLISNCTAIKLSGMDPRVVSNFHGSLCLDPELEGKIVDVSTASHVHRTGTVYVQHIKAHTQEVITAVEDCLKQLKNPEGSSHGIRAAIMNGFKDGDQTLYSRDTLGATPGSSTKSMPIPSSKWATVLPEAPPPQVSPPPTIPKTIRTEKPRSFSEAVMRGVMRGSDPYDAGSSENGSKAGSEYDVKSSDDETGQNKSHDNESTGGTTIKTNNTGSTAKSRREILLETECNLLKETVKELQEDRKELQADRQALKDQVQLLTEQMAMLLEQTKSNQARIPAAKLPRPPPTDATPTSRKKSDIKQTPETIHVGKTIQHDPQIGDSIANHPIHALRDPTNYQGMPSYPPGRPPNPGKSSKPTDPKETFTESTTTEDPSANPAKGPNP